MKVFGRNIRPVTILAKLLDVLKMSYESRIFESRWQLIKNYILGSVPEEKIFKTKDGYSIYLSDSPLDVTTLMVIFCRKEYGNIPKGSTILDIGANIGLFSLYAAREGAGRVFAFEPNRKAFETLCENIRCNGLEHIVFPFNLAVSGRDDEIVHIPKLSSPYNRILYDVAEEQVINFDLIKTVSLKSIVENYAVIEVDLCKMDCEGAEYDILYSLEDATFRKIREIRLEHHVRDRKIELINYLRTKGYSKTFDHNIIMWFESHV